MRKGESKIEVGEKEVGYLFVAAEMWRCVKDRRRERTEEKGRGKRKEYCAVPSCEAGKARQSKARQGI
jgi:hypothetical protein